MLCFSIEGVAPKLASQALRNDVCETVSGHARVMVGSCSEHGRIMVGIIPHALVNYLEVGVTLQKNFNRIITTPNYFSQVGGGWEAKYL